ALTHQQKIRSYILILCIYLDSDAVISPLIALARLSYPGTPLVLTSQKRYLESIEVRISILRSFACAMAAPVMMNNDSNNVFLNLT
ncbi:hypothetical protein, partial [Klebsiella variicola]|uniref:hypothetical protein n=1 Tax=Klebsiella variicola TaxID=244366 RepID=UPI002B057520